jgi:hypothetical protein
MNQKENLLRAIRRDKPEWVPCGMESEIFLVLPVIECPARPGKDDWGVSWDYPEGGGVFPLNKDFVITDIERWHEQLKIPDIESYDWSKLELGFDRRPIDWQSVDRNEHLITGALNFGIFERTWLLLGMENAFVYLLTEPDFVKELANEIAEYNVRMVHKVYEVLRPDMIRYGDDWGNQRQLMMPPDVWRYIFKPAVKKVYDAIHEHGIMVFQHSCGKIEDIFPDLLDMGMDVYDPCQPSNDLKKLKELYGKQVSFCGGLDSQGVLGYPGVTEEAIRIEIRRRIDEMGEGGGYIARPSHDVPYKDYVMRTMEDEIHKYGKYR